MVLLTLLQAVTGLAFAQTGAAKMLQNAYKNTYANSWECDRGYCEADGACAAIYMPANAYATDSSCAWL